MYVLTMDNKDGSLGPLMRKSTLTCPGPGCDFKLNPGALTARGLTTDRLAFSMANFSGLGRLIVDRTGLTGGYDIELEWTPTTDGPSIFTALREQLGLKLESSRGPVPMLVIERVEKPSEN
ncbi:MAG TPA: TIGR03435 family protein [Vicinamibacterales bacterium]|nr:TIGR03435 family protein [Vicinamibacterales bacterium]